MNGTNFLYSPGSRTVTNRSESKWVIGERFLFSPIELWTKKE